MSENQQEYNVIENYVMFKELSNDALGVNHRAGAINPETRQVENHYLVTELYPFLYSKPGRWKRVNILLEGVKKSNIPKLFSPDRIFQADGKYYLAYPYLKTRTFEQVLEESAKKDMPINFDLSFSIAFAIADLIDIGSSIVVSGEKSFHGFLTPDNILIDYDGKILLKNYGIYPYLSQEAEIVTEMEKKYGAWIAPEFLRREKLVCQSDIYHLGYITYRILTGKYFSFTPGEDFDSKFANISFLQHIPSSDKEYLTNILTFFKKTLHPVPSQRFANIKEFKDFISNQFRIEELSSVTFNLAYFMNSLYLETTEEENKAMEEELTYVVPEKKKEEPGEASRADKHLVQDILTGLDEQKKAKARLLIPLVALIVIIVAASIFIIVSQQKQVQQRVSTEDMQRSMEQFKVGLEAEYHKRLKAIEEKTTETEAEKKAQEDEIKKLRNWQKDEIRSALERQKQDAQRLQKLKEEEEVQKRKELAKEQEIERQKKLEEQNRLEAAKKKKQEEQRKELVKEEQVSQGQLISLLDVTKRPEKIKGKNPTFSPILKRKYRGREIEIGTIILIDETGTVANVRIISQSPDDLNSVVSRALKRWKYNPAEKDNVKVKVWLPMAIKIVL